MIALETLSRLLRLGADVLEGRVLDGTGLTRALIGLGLDLVPVDELRAHLDAEAAARARALADVAEATKFAP